MWLDAFMEWFENIEIETYQDMHGDTWYDITLYWDGFERENVSLNDLCSIDSGLWQFVCNEWLLNIENHGEDWYLNWDWHETYMNDEWEYRIMKSSIQEDKEKFLLENIKIWK